MDSTLLNRIFTESIEKYHIKDDVNQEFPELYSPDSVEYLLFKKNWIDTVQWHLEDIIRKPDINPVEALKIKRRIDKSNQDRTDLVEDIDDFLFEKFKDVKPKPDAILNTETPAWAIDRLSILNLKIYHMREEAQRPDADEVHRATCDFKLSVLLQQQKDLSAAVDQLFENLQNGSFIVKTYKQMKMYNDPNLNPMLRKK